jgi:SagB-type dehydrogenase family enzyme
MTSLETVLAYHEATKHRFDGYARGPGRMDWATQPDPFRRYEGAPLISLAMEEPGDEPSYASVFTAAGGIPPLPGNIRSISRLLYDSMALSAWKSAGGVNWPLRINPSSGNLHPTECYLLCGAVEGLCPVPMVCHYAPKEHGLEVRAELSGENWEKLVAEFPVGTVFVGFTSIHWRESWKYGERAYRYCQLDAGHALGAVALAAAAIGWEARLLDDPGSEELALLFGVAGQLGPEAEEPDCLVAVFPRGNGGDRFALNRDAVREFASLHWQGKPSRLSPSHRDWMIIDSVAMACRKPHLRPDCPSSPVPSDRPAIPVYPGSFRRIVHRRRSAVAMDGVSSMPLESFYALLERTVFRPGIPPFDLFPWPSLVHLALFVHRVDDLFPGLYLLLRNHQHLEELRDRLDVEYLWQRPASCPDGIDLYLLAVGDARIASRDISCFQEIASEGCFSLGMLAKYSRLLEERGPWFYPWLFRECGMIGQVLYLEAEAAGLRGTGIGCFFDDPMHEVLGLEGNSYQDLYHFTVGGPVEDRRITTLAPYPDQRDRA